MFCTNSLCFLVCFIEVQEQDWAQAGERGKASLACNKFTPHSQAIIHSLKCTNVTILKAQHPEILSSFVNRFCINCCMVQVSAAPLKCFTPFFHGQFSLKWFVCWFKIQEDKINCFFSRRNWTCSLSTNTRSTFKRQMTQQTLGSTLQGWHVF